MFSHDESQVLPAARRAGACLHITALPGKYGVGDVGDEAFAFVDALQRMELSVWQFLPVGPTAYGDSPYQPLSTFAGNEMLISIGDLLRRALLRADEVEPLTKLPRDAVDYGRLIPLKSSLLGTAATRFPRRANARQKARFDEFLDKHDDAWLHEYALFRVLKDRHGQRPWPEWQQKYVQFDDKALRQLESEEARRIAELKIIQFLFHDQWQRLRNYANESGVQFFGDMPIYIALDSSDAWANPDLLRINREGEPDAVAGVPPDYFSANGQLWGNPLYDWKAHAASGYRWWVERFRAAAELSDLVRVDHFRGFEGYWAVPADAETAKNGAWEPGPGDAIFDAMKKSLGYLPMIAEDLGVITPEVEALRDRHGIPGMVVLQFDVRDHEFTLESVRENCVCYTGTHDNDTTVGWFRGSPGDNRSEKEIAETRELALKLASGSADSIAENLVRAALSTAARLAIAPMQDYLGLGSEARFNVPGTSGNNWRWRVQRPQIDDRFCDRVAQMVADSGRGVADQRELAAG